MNNPCPRCGKQRITTKEWQETIKAGESSSVVTFTLTVCPDSKCQMALEKSQEEKRLKMDEMKQKSIEKARARVHNSRKVK